MSIDMKSYAGEIDGQAAVDQQVIDTNSYQSNQLDGEPVHKEFLEPVGSPDTVAPPQPAQEETPSKQELNFKALREEVDRMKADRDKERSEFQQQIDMYRANAPKQESHQERKMFEGLKDDDIPSVGDIERAFKQKEENYQARIEELQVAQQYSDYNEVLQKYVAPLIQQKPHLAGMIQGAPNKALAAYELGQMARQSQEAKVVTQEQTKKSDIAQKIVENSRKPGTLSSAGGQSVLSKADYYSSMSDKQFAEFASKNLEI
jgi:hypothetical protein